MTEDVETPKREDVYIYYRPTENCVAEELVVYENAKVDHPMSKDFVFVMRGSKVVGAIRSDLVVRVDVVPAGAPAPGPTRHQPTQG